MTRSGQAAGEYAALALERVETVLGSQLARAQDFVGDHTALVLVALGVIAFVLLRPRRRL